jgi:hypothetical protein
MLTALQKTQDTARRIDRLGRFFASTKPPEHEMSVTKDHGELTMLWRGEPVEQSLHCELKSGLVWEKRWRHVHATGERQNETSTLAESPEAGLARLQEFEQHLTERVKKAIEREVLEGLVAKRLKRITRPKTRGFKADLKKKRPKKAE